jgi:rhamnose transport system permease protein
VRRSASRAAGSPVTLVVRHRELVVLLFLVVLSGFFALKATNFATVANWQNILLNVAMVAVVATGETMVVLTRNIDISVGSAAGLSAFLCAQTSAEHHGAPIVAIVLLAIVIGAAVGVLNGLLVTRARIPAIIATLATLTMVRGLLVDVTGGESVQAYQLPSSFLNLASDQPLGVPLLAWIAISVVIAGSIVLRYARWGREFYVIGSNPPAARVAGVPVGPRVFLAFVISGGLAGLGGFIFAAQYANVDSTAAAGFEFIVVTAVVIGGVNIFGGSGTAVGAALGALLVAVIQNGFILLKVSEFWELFLDGAAIVLAVTFDALVTRRLDAVRRRRLHSALLAKHG